MRKVIYFLIAVLFISIFFLFTCRELWGDHPLGNHLDLLEGDHIQDRIIVYCSSKDFGTCTGGVPVIPTYEHEFIDGKYAEYVETAKSNQNWVIAKSLQIKDNKEKYWIINKDFDVENADKINFDSIIQAHITGPLDIIAFKKKLREFNIDLSFD